MKFEDYKKFNAINASFLKACSFGPYQGYKYLHDTPYQSDAMLFGSAVHDAILSPDVFAKEYAFAPKVDRRTKDGKAAFAEFENRNAGKKILTSDDLYKIAKIKTRLFAIPEIAAALVSFEKEKTIIWNTSIGKMKARLDLVDVENKVIIDLKTTRDGSEREFTKQLLSLRYDIQLRHYCYSLNSPATVYSIAVESESTEVAMYDITDIVQSEYTSIRYARALETAVDVLKMTECPPKFKPEIINLTLPKWAEEEVLS